MNGEVITAADRDTLNIALNEATWIGIVVDTIEQDLALLMSVLSLPIDGPVAAESPTVITLQDVSRIAVSFEKRPVGRH